MDTVMLLKIESLHARAVEEKGLKLRMEERDIYTGPMVANLDDSASFPANCGMINLTTGFMRLHWGVIVTMPLSADAFVGGTMSHKNSAAIKIAFEEQGHVLEDDSGAQLVSKGSIVGGTMLTGITIPQHMNRLKIYSHSEKVKGRLVHTLSAGKAARCILTPDSFLDLALPKSLGGGKQRLHMTGGFYLVPAMTLKQPKGKMEAV